jgi:sugar O-acyltransferase (sialic acid O-acetyltransferase NeuD family)
MNRQTLVKQKLILWGGASQAKVLRDSFKTLDYSLVAIFDDNKAICSPFKDVPYLGGREEFQEWVKSISDPEEIAFLVAIGAHHGRIRVMIQSYLASFGLKPLIITHKTAYVADDASIGLGSQVLANAVVNTEAKLGIGCIVNTNAIVDHECRLGKGVHIGPGATLAGRVVVENYVTIYTNATVITDICIGEGSIVGAGAVVTRNVEPYTIVVGNPAKYLKSTQG